jgi:hypothetical protein
MYRTQTEILDIAQDIMNAEPEAFDWLAFGMDFSSSEIRQVASVLEAEGAEDSAVQVRDMAELMDAGRWNPMTL